MLYDPERLKLISCGDAVVERELLDLFENTLKQTEAAIQKGEWSMPLHTLKGAAANLGGEKLFRLCMQYEALAPSKVASESFLAALADLRGK